jgi:hypothetical protein
MLSDLGISEQFTRPIRYKFPKVKDMVFPQSGYNYQGDLLELPTTPNGYKYLLTVIDIYSNYCDFEPLKTKSANEVLSAFKKIFKRGIVPEPKASVRTDSGSEFKSVVDKYMYDNNILHLWSLKDRHKQMANVESLNRVVARVLMTYLQNKGDGYKNWTDIIEPLRKGLNDAKSHPKDQDMSKYTPPMLNLEHPPKYKVGDLVYRRLEKSINDSGQQNHDKRFRAGDVRYEMVPRKIKQVVLYSSPNPYRYILETIPSVSYAEQELLPAENETAEKYRIKKIVGKKTEKKKTYYLVHWQGFKVADATWEPKQQLIEDGFQNVLNDYDESLKSKKKK